MSVVIEVKLKNNPNGAVPDGTGGILRVTQDGQIVDNPPLGSKDTIPLYTMLMAYEKLLEWTLIL
jgi:hypothetical protein